MRPYKVYAIEEGVVIDHIPPKKACDVINVLGALEGDSIVTLGVNLDSKQMGKKDVVKIERKELSWEELMKIALIAPDASLNIIKGHKVVDKLKIKVPAMFEKVVRCPNPNCITRHEPVDTKFHTVSERPFRLRCHFCERVFEREEVSLI
ncbi:aspartate carbamoyltransferase regulatory subunit [Candidatus Woesearchaeota archaeon CG10_big_fil_rev_8_21_14_0_10_44_13]|nr:MAG: aspartate carbamoyltransferase regulatory subunit [Candidatus Woesearchaeota archaeon CG10_big_fil_rev_8_21_14_0_10_44_13]